MVGRAKSDFSIPSSYSADYFQRGRDYAEKLRRGNIFLDSFIIDYRPILACNSSIGCDTTYFYVHSGWSDPLDIVVDSPHSIFSSCFLFLVNNFPSPVISAPSSIVFFVVFLNFYTQWPFTQQQVWSLLFNFITDMLFFLPKITDMWDFLLCK